MGSQYNDGQRAFLQAIMARGSFTLSEGKSIVAAILTIEKGRPMKADEVTSETLDSYIAVAAEAVSYFEYEICSTQHQMTKCRIYAFVNSLSDPLTQLATVRSPDELLYIKRLLDAMFETNNSRRKEVMAIRSMQALESKIRKGDTDRGLTQNEAEKLLNTLEKEKWLERSPKGFYSLAPRALIELRTWLKETYNDSDDVNTHQKIKFCTACKEIVTVGQRCCNLDCDVRLHKICEAAYWKSRSSRDCPKCLVEWKGDKFVGEMAITSAEKDHSRESRGEKRKRETEPNENDNQNSDPLRQPPRTPRHREMDRQDLYNNNGRSEEADFEAEITTFTPELEHNQSSNEE